MSSVKRWCKRYDGTWKSLAEKSHRPHSHPKRHTEEEEQLILKCFQKKYLRYGWDGVYDEAVKNGYTRSFSGMVYAAKRMGLGGKNAKKPARKHDRRYPDLKLHWDCGILDSSWIYYWIFYCILQAVFCHPQDRTSAFFYKIVLHLTCADAPPCRYALELPL